MIRPMRRRLSELFLAALAGLMLLAFVPVAGANSALDQYVEQVPDPGGPVIPKPTPPAASPGKKSESDRGSYGSGDSAGTSAVETAPVAPAPAPASPVTHKPKKKHRTKKATLDTTPRHRGGAHLSPDRPQQMAAWSQAAKVSGFNAPLAVFVALVGIGMVALSIWRRTRGESR